MAKKKKKNATNPKNKQTNKKHNGKCTEKVRKDNTGNWKKMHGPEYALVFKKQKKREGFEILFLH